MSPQESKDHQTNVEFENNIIVISAFSDVVQCGHYQNRNRNLGVPLIFLNASCSNRSVHPILQDCVHFVTITCLLSYANQEYKCPFQTMTLPPRKGPHSYYYYYYYLEWHHSMPLLTFRKDLGR